MPRRFPLRFLALALLLLLPAPPLALLCRGRTPTRFDAQNLPVWERRSLVQHRPGHELRRKGILRATLKRKKESAFG